jgi:hypothetical protein
MEIIFNNVMLDLETMGNKSNSVIVSIGAVEFDINNGVTNREFYSRVDFQSCLDIGLKVDASTVLWWLKQNENARIELTKEADHIVKVLSDLNTWFSTCPKYFSLWGNGARFDIGLLEDAYVAASYNKLPWDFRDEMDVRTIVKRAPEVKKQVIEEFKNKGIEHHPIFDCKVQIEYLTRIWNMFELKK